MTKARWSAALIGTALAALTLTPAHAAQPNPSAALDRIDQRDLPLDKSYHWTATGAGVRVYVLSSGVSTTHADFGGRATQAVDLIGGPACSTTAGTGLAALVAGSKYGVAKEAQIVSVKAYPCGRPSPAQVIAGINWVSQHAVKPAVAVLPDTFAANADLDAAIEHSVQTGVTWVVGAGNQGTDFGGDACALSPARVPAAITATHLDLTAGRDRLFPGANRGRCIDLAAPTGTTAIGGGAEENPWSINGGHVAVTAGAAAKLLSQTPTATPAVIQQQLTSAATTGKLGQDAAGTPDRILFSN